MHFTSIGRAVRAAVSLGAACAVTALAACAGSGDDLDDDMLSADELAAADLLVTAFNEAHRMSSELRDAEARILERCMEDQGFLVHDPTMIRYTDGDAVAFDDFGATGPVSEVPEADEAAETAFAVWLEHPESAEEHPDGGRGHQMNVFDDPRFDAWNELGEDESLAWTAAFMGEDKTAASRADLHPDLDLPPFQEVPYGGCLAVMADEVYGGFEYKEIEPDYEAWVWGIDEPYWHDGWSDRDRLYKSLMAEPEQALEECVADQGYPGWELNDGGWFNVRAFFTDLYFPDGGYGYADRWLTGIPAIEPVPTEYHVIKTLEFQMAADFAACADETGWREESHRVWRDLRSAEMLDMEVELFAWHDALSEALQNAQDALASDGY